MNFIDGILNRVTMYRLMLYYLIVLYGAAIIFSLFGIIRFNPFDFIFSGLFLIGACWLSNQLFSRLFHVKPNYESQYITGLILALIIGPIPLLSNILFLTLASVLAMASKYFIAINKQHIFNPAACAVVGTALILNQGASWWAGDSTMLPFIIIGGLLVVYKINRFHLVLSFLISSILSLLLFNRIGFQDTYAYIINPGTLFFTFVMLTEPITSPADRKLRMYFGVFTGIILTLYQTFFGVFYTMELALLTANLIGRMLRFSTKYSLVLKEKKGTAAGIWEFLFTPAKPIAYVPGQYLEWSLPHPHTDSRGNRRYFTIASSPTEKEVLLAVKIPDNASSYKKALASLKPGDSLYATNLEGEFVLQKDKTASYVFIAGGIGITPFRSIIKYILDNNLTYQLTLFYIAHTSDELVFDELFEQAKKKIGLQVIHVISENPPKNWQGETGRLTDSMIKKYVKGITSRIFYLSGPQPMIIAYKKLLLDVGIKPKNIKTDYFPGYEEKS